MSNIGIRVGVEAGQVKDARREVDGLNKNLRETESFNDLAPGKDGLNESSALVRKITEDIRRMKGLVARGDRQGGLLDKGQLQEADKLTKNIRGNIETYAQGISRARSEIGKLIVEKNKLVQSGKNLKFESAEDYITRTNRIKQIDEQVAGKRKAYRLDRHDEKLRDMEGRFGEASDKIGSFGNRWKMPAWSKRVMAPIAGALTAAAVYNYMKSSKDLFVNAYSGGAADLAMRGGKISLDSTHGFKPLESLSIYDTLNRSTGAYGDRLGKYAETAKQFTRDVGTSAGVTTGYMGGMYMSTGFQNREMKEHLKLLKDTATAIGQRGRIEDILANNQRIVSGIVKARGGKELSLREVDGITSLQMMLESMPGMMGKGESGAQLLSQIDSSIRGGGGSPGEKLFMFKALGGDKVRTAEDYWNFKRRQSKGIGDPDNLGNVRNLLFSQFGKTGSGELSYEGRTHAMSILGLTPEQVDLISSKNFSLKRDMTGSREGKKRIAEYDAKNAATLERENEARLEQAKIKSGREVQKKGGRLYDSTKTNALDIVSDILAGDENAINSRIDRWLDAHRPTYKSVGFSDRMKAPLRPDMIDTSEIAENRIKEVDVSPVVEEQRKTNDILTQILSGQAINTVKVGVPVAREGSPSGSQY